MSEYGFQALPAIATIEKFTDAQDRQLESKGPNRFSQVMSAHQKHPTGFETIDEYLSHRQERELKSDIFTTYKDSLQIKDPEDILLLLKQVSENKDVAK